MLHTDPVILRWFSALVLGQRIVNQTDRLEGSARRFSALNQAQQILARLDFQQSVQGGSLVYRHYSSKPGTFTHDGDVEQQETLCRNHMLSDALRSGIARGLIDRQWAFL